MAAHHVADLAEIGWLLAGREPPAIARTVIEYTVRADGSGARRLTTNEAYDPSYAGDGRIAYKRFDGI